MKQIVFLIASILSLAVNVHAASSNLSAEAFCRDWAKFPISTRIMVDDYMLDSLLGIQLHDSQAIVSLTPGPGKEDIRIGTLQIDWKKNLRAQCGTNPYTSDAGGFFSEIMLDAGWSLKSSDQEVCAPNIIDGQQDGFMRNETKAYFLINSEAGAVIQLGTSFRVIGPCQ